MPGTPSVPGGHTPGLRSLIGMIREAADRFEAEAIERDDIEPATRTRHLCSVRGAREFCDRLDREISARIGQTPRDVAEARTVLRAIQLGGYLVQPNRDDSIPPEMIRVVPPGARIGRHTLMDAEARAENAAAFDAELRTRDDYPDR